MTVDATVNTEFEYQKAQEFYEKHYKIERQWFLVPGREEFLGRSDLRQCRFCDRKEPEATFETLAHAIPESMGNKSLFSFYECDECNAYFGHGIESDFGNWSLPIRTMTRIKGKKGVPTLVKDGKGGWRIEAVKRRELRVEMKEATPIYTVDEEKKQITFHLTRQNYTPVAVLKAFMKMGLTLLPQQHMYYFSALREWVKNPDHRAGAVTIPILYTFQPGPLPNDKLVAMILVRKADYMRVPYVYFVIAYGNEMFQVQLPSSREPASASYTLPYFPYAPSSVFAPLFGNPQRASLDLSGTEKVRESAYPYTARYSERKEVEMDACVDENRA